VYFRIASSLPLPAMTARRVKACYKDIAKSVIVRSAARRSCISGLLRRYVPRNDDPSRIVSSHIQLTKIDRARNKHACISNNLKSKIVNQKS
jgi:hypothetical protein